ncbi:MAG: exodeoxyribonuclease I [Candidatus Thioglobus sp.]|nr:MAG: exodeoxyribonuclease I [Candidatus Thioglobus sp.]RUM81452.1 MAG: exodeoxyribonuclease I [Candidatus Thioglobus sp.]
MKTFYWYDYETFGISPRIDRISQFAGIRTDENLNILDEHMFYCKPTHDCLPAPEACAVTGISPQLCEQKGMIEHAFIQKINTEFSTSNTCIVGYNSIRFDDEFTRHTLYRNFIDPYAWHWKNGNTRWDILDVVRLCYALKKDASLEWVYDENGKPIFKLDQLSLANGIEHANAHDALADVRATISIAKIIKDTQPQLFDYAFSLREKKTVERKIQLFEPMLHTSGMYPAEKSCTRLAVALAYHPEYNDRAIVFNLDQDPTLLLELEVEELKALMFTKQSELPKGVERLQIKDLVFNKSPMFVPNVYKLESKIIEQLQIDMETCLRRLSFIKDNQKAIGKIVQDLYKNDQERIKTTDVDQTLYDGFMDNGDKRIGDQIQTLSVDALKDFHPKFKDDKLSILLMHFKARNYPEALSEDEAEDWFETVQGRVQAGENGYLAIDEYFQRINAMREQHPNNEKLWQQLEAYGESFF